MCIAEAAVTTALGAWATAAGRGSGYIFGLVLDCTAFSQSITSDFSLRDLDDLRGHLLYFPNQNLLSKPALYLTFQNRFEEFLRKGHPELRHPALYTPSFSD